MSSRFDTSDETERERGLGAAALAVRRGDLVVVPTDTVYGVGCDAFDPDALATDPRCRFPQSARRRGDR